MIKHPKYSVNSLVKIITIFIILLQLLVPDKTFGQNVTGKILNEQNEPIPYATIFIYETKEGTISNSEGKFSLSLEKGTYNFTIRSLGYNQIENRIILASDTLNIDFKMQRQEFEIKEVKIFPGKEDPAYFIIRKAITNAAYFRKKIKHFEADLYIKSNFNFINIPKFYQNKIEVNGIKLKDAFKEDVTYIIESQNKITFDYPEKYNQEVITKKSSLVGFDEPPIMGLMTSNFYEDRPNQVISPLSSLALKHYKFQYEGFITVGDSDIFKIKVIPKRRSDELVSGYIYIVDRLWCIYNIDFNARIEFFKYHIKQQYENLGNKNWMPVSHLIDGNFSLLGLKGEFYYGASLKYNSIEENEEFQDPNISESDEDIHVEKINKKEEELKKQVALITAKEELTNHDVKKAARLNRKILKEQYKDSTLTEFVQNTYNFEDKKDTLRTDTFSWEKIRAIPLTPAEIKSYELTDSLLKLETIETDSLPEIKKEKSVLLKIIAGHYDLCKDSLVRLRYPGLISPENFDFNTVDGYKYKQSLNFSANPDSGKYIYINPKVGYAFNRKAFFGSVETRFQNILMNNNQLQIDFGKESRDFKHFSNGINAELNSISSWFFAQNYMKLYETSFFRINFTQKTFKNLYLKSLVEYNNFSPLQNSISYKLSDKKEYSPNIPNGLTASSPVLQQQKSLVYAFGINYTKQQQKPWLQSSEFLFISNFYNISLSFKQGINSVLNSNSDFSQIDFKFQQQANISPSAGIDWHVNAGYFFKSNQMHFSQFKHFNTSEIAIPFKSFTNTFQLLNDYEFSTNKSYINVGAEYRTEYLLFRYLSIFNKRTWSESLHLNYLTTPALKDYWEAGYSLNNLFYLGNLGVFAGFRENKFESVAIKFSISGL